MGSRLVNHILLLLTLLTVGPFALASSGGSNTGGGDDCERRITQIRDEIDTWIVQGGSSRLKLPKGLDHDTYTSAVRRQMQRAQVRCVSRGDAGFPVFIRDHKTRRNVPKICRFDRTVSQSLITCDTEKFMKLDEGSRFVLVHHEYAGLAGVEKPDGAKSRYEISNQLSSFLVDIVVKKLALTPQSEVECLNAYPTKTPLKFICRDRVQVDFDNLLQIFEYVGRSTTDTRDLKNSFIAIDKLDSNNAIVSIVPANEYHFRVVVETQSAAQPPLLALQLSQLMSDRMVLDLKRTGDSTTVSVNPKSIIAGVSAAENLEICDLKKATINDCVEFKIRVGQLNDLDVSMRLNQPSQDLDEDDADAGLSLQFRSSGNWALTSVYGNGNDIDDIDKISIGWDLANQRTRVTSAGAKSRTCRPGKDRCAVFTKSVPYR